MTAVKRRRLPVIRYLFDEARPTVVVRSKRHKASAPRLTRAGNRPELLGPLSLEERQDLELDEWELLAEGLTFGPPKDDRECPPGPCVRAGCRHHLAVDVDVHRLRLNFPGRDLDEIPETCSLRVARMAAERREGEPFSFEEPVMTSDEAGVFMNLAPEAVRALTNRALIKFRARMRAVLEGRPLDKSGALPSRGGR